MGGSQMGQGCPVEAEFAAQVAAADSTESNSARKGEFLDVNRRRRQTRRLPKSEYDG